LFYAPVKGVNVVAKLPSTIASRKYVILGAHYDTERTSPGAIDNATGIALILDVVKKISHLKVRNVNFLVVFFDQEEDNEVGSKEFVKTLSDTDKEIESVHIFDLIGWDSNKNRKIAIQSPPAFLQKAYQLNAVNLDISIQVIQGASSDNKSFLREGYNTVLISDEIEDLTPYYHSSKDGINTVDFEYLALITKLVYKTLQVIANG
jgi:Zn-dependent M28 family amino/carboxypeptidase